jgi:glycosyltransferase involved in cell wall biosynthesis
MSSEILFTIVTPTLNGQPFLEGNIQSLKEQGIPPDQIEHWVIDGGSTDGTLDILRGQSYSKWISEPDRGLSDAVNKGIQRATGPWILWLNADDRFARGALKTFLSYAEKHPEIRLFCGDELVLRYDGSAERRVRGRKYTFEEMVSRSPSMNQASTFVHRDVYAKVGLLDVQIKYAMDYEWLVRALREFECVYIPETLSIYQRREGSIMDANMAAHYRTFQRVRRKYGRSIWEPLEWKILFFLWTDPLRRKPRLRRLVRRLKRALRGEASAATP